MGKRLKTRSNRKKSTAPLTIPQLKKAFDYIEEYAATMKPSIADFQKEWVKVFGRKISEDNVSAYLDFIANRKTGLRKFRGGAAPGLITGQGLIAGAVTDSGLRPYGIFQEYIGSGFEVGVPAMASQEMCATGFVGPQGPAPTVVNGGRRREAKRTLRRIRGGRFPFSTSPPSFSQNIFTQMRGQPLAPSDSAIENPYISTPALL